MRTRLRSYGGRAAIRSFAIGGPVLFLEQRQIMAIETVQMVFHLANSGIAVAGLEIFHEAAA